MEIQNKNILRIAVVMISVAAISLVIIFSRDIFLSSKESSLSELQTKNLENQTIKITGKVVKTMRNYVSKKGDKYFQFVVSDGENSFKVFCKQTDEKIKVKENDNVEIMGKFIKFRNQNEIAYCNKPYGYVKILE